MTIYGAAGLGLTYFPIMYFGIGAESAAYDGTRNFFDYGGGNIYARFPFQCIHLAPYIYGGGGRSFNPNSAWYYNGGAGLEYRICPKFGIFGDARYIWREIADNISGHVNQVEARAGVKFIF